MVVSVIFTALLIINSVVTLPEEISVGGLFEINEKLSETAFLQAVEHVNQNNKYLSRTKLEAETVEVPEFNSYAVGKSVCRLLSQGVGGIFGPKSRDTWDYVQSICDTMEIPHIETNWDHSQRRGSCLVNLYPHPSTLALAFADIVKRSNWNGFTIIYDEDLGLMRMSELIKIADTRGYMVTVRQLNISDPMNNFRPMLKEVKISGQKNIVVECTRERLYEVLLQAQQVGLMGSEYTYLITSMDFQTIDVSPFQWAGTNITGVRMIDPERPEVVRIAHSWEHYLPITEPQYEGSPPLVHLLQMGPALLYDAVQLYAQALDYLDKSLNITISQVNCEKHTNWEHGYSIINYMKMSEIDGLTGPVKFDHEGFRREINMDVLELTEEGLRKKGIWSRDHGLIIEPSPPKPARIEGADLRNMSFIVLIAMTAPYGMLKESSIQLTGNDRFEGYGIDLIEELAKMSGFNYTFVVQEDGASGNPLNKDLTQWSGMIGQVMKGTADLAIADITITMVREKVVDFTMPFMNLGISILHRKAGKQPPSLFSFLSPFSLEVWAYMMSAYLGVSLLLYVMARISPYEWRNPYPCIEEPEVLENQFSLSNSLWFTMGSLMQQGSDVAPISVSTRMVAAIWWFFTLIMVSSYTANLAAFLTIELNAPRFRDVKELAEQKIIKYGAKEGGSTADFFKNSNNSLYQKMWKSMMEHKDEVMVKSNAAGVDKVLHDDNENYAFFMESASIQYEVERKCKLAQIGNLLDNKGYGIVMRKNSTYRDTLITNVVKLQEKGKLKQLENKWWKEKRGGGACQTSGSEAKPLDLGNVGGVFVVTVAGLVFALFVSIGEALWDIHFNDEKVSFIDELKKHIRFVMKCHGTTKPVKGSASNSLKSSSRSLSNDTFKNTADQSTRKFSRSKTPSKTPPSPGFKIS